MRDVVFFLRNDKLYVKRWESLLGTHCYAESSKDSIYFMGYTFNPLTRTMLEIASDEQDRLYEMDDQDKVYFQALLHQFAKRYELFVDTNYCGPGCYYTVVGGEHKKPSKDTTNDRLIHSFNTMVHETTHKFNSFNSILVDPEIAIHFPNIETYRSQEFLPLVPQEAKTKIFRYATYVSTKSTLGSNQCGILGIMNEFSAYRNGTRVSIEAALAAKAQGNEKRKLDFLNEALLSYYAYYEFRVFIAWYLEYGAKYILSLHRKLMANTNFRIAFTLLEQGFLEDIKLIEKLVKESPSVQWQYDIFEKDYAAYSKELLIKQEKLLATFRVAGVTKMNYKNFLVPVE